MTRFGGSARMAWPRSVQLTGLATKRTMRAAPQGGLDPEAPRLDHATLGGRVAHSAHSTNPARALRNQWRDAMTRQERAPRYYQGFGWRCAVLRQAAGLSEREAATKAGIDVRTWRKIEAGGGCQTMIFLKMGQAFGCSLDWLLCGRKAA
jgi:hypothetical protein